VLSYGTRSQGISQFYLHTPRSSANGMNHTCLCLPSRSWSSFTDPEGMEGWVNWQGATFNRAPSWLLQSKILHTFLGVGLQQSLAFCGPTVWNIPPSALRNSSVVAEDVHVQATMNDTEEHHPARLWRFGDSGTVRLWYRLQSSWRTRGVQKVRRL